MLWSENNKKFGVKKPIFPPIFLQFLTLFNSKFILILLVILWSNYKYFFYGYHLVRSKIISI